MTGGIPEALTVAMGIDEHGKHMILAIDEDGSGVPSPMVALGDEGRAKVRAVAQAAHDMLGVGITVAEYRLSGATTLYPKKPEGT